MTNALGLYIHIPFCVKKCAYCDFISIGIGSGSGECMDRMINCLIKELELRSQESAFTGQSASSVFIGGGTPSLVPVGLMERLLKAIGDYKCENAEFTIECNPGTVTEEKLELYRNMGVNRISIGLQSTQDDELKTLGRIHTHDEFLITYDRVRKCGFDIVNIDLMSGIPGQTIDSFRETLDRVIRLEPEHISVYSLIIEPGTPFYEKYADAPPADEETDRRMYLMTEEMLTGAGYDHYEVSNYARKTEDDEKNPSGNPYVCRHNLNYWRRGAYIGIGPSAASLTFFQSDAKRDPSEYGIRQTNTPDLSEYMIAIEKGQIPVKEKEELVREEAEIEEIYLGLRTSDGIDLKKWYDRYSGLELKWLPVLTICRQEGLIVIEDGRMRLTGAGFFVSDRIVKKLMKD